ncbi:MAG: class I SAM-dependent methyltransferase [Egibacteraceae bacterium]
MGRSLDKFVAHYGDVPGLVRSHVLQTHLKEHLRSPPARLIDVGGGSGQQSLPLAGAGYDVTILDPSPTMLSRELQAGRGRLRPRRGVV